MQMVRDKHQKQNLVNKTTRSEKKCGSRYQEPWIKKTKVSCENLQVFLHLWSSNLDNRQKSKTNKHKKMLVSCYWPIVSSEKLSLKLNSSEAYHGPWPQEQGSCFVKHLPMAASSNKKFLYWYHQLLYILKCHKSSCVIMRNLCSDFLIQIIPSIVNKDEIVLSCQSPLHLPHKPM